MADTREAAEQQLETAAEQALEAWLSVALAEVVAPAGIDPTAPLRAAAEWAEQIEDRLLPIIRDTWRARFEAITDRPPARSLIASYLDAAVNRMVRVPDEVAARIQQIVARNIGTSVPDMAALIDGELQFTGTENWPNRATVIARTESAGAWNGAQLAGYRADRERYGLDLMKRWLATDDERTRLTHNMADGQTVPLDGSYTVGGFSMDFPGDPRGPAHEVINCRCAMRIGTAGELSFARGRVFPVLPVIRSFARDDNSDTVCIMALPAQSDPVQDIGPEEKHATLLYFGKISEHGDSERMGSSRNLLLDVLAVAARSQAPFDAAVTGVEPLGDDDPPAQVWMLDSPELRRLFDAIPDIDSEVHSLYVDAKATRYPSYKPHVTIGYGGPEVGTDDAREGDLVSDDMLDEARQVDAIGFDRLALWWGVERYEFPLDGSPLADDIDGYSAVVRWGEFNWVEDCGGLPSLIKRIARHVPGGESRGIPVAVNAVKETCATGDVNWPGIQQVNPGYRAEACAAAAEWEALKACARANGD